MRCDDSTEYDVVPEKGELPELPDGVPVLRSFYLYMTSGCNLCCKHCWINPSFEKGIPSHGDYIDLQLLKNAVSTAKPLGLSQTKLTGGEPLLHPDFLDIVDFLHEQELIVTMETNGTLITRDIATHLKQRDIKHISVSLDSPRPEYHDKFRGVAGAFDKTVEGIKHLVAAGYNPQIIMCPHHGNLHELEELIQLAIELRAGSVKFNPVNKLGRGQYLHDDGEGLSFKETLTLVHYINNELQRKYQIPLISLLPPALHSVRELLKSRRGGGTCGVLTVLGILGSGEMALCGIGRTIPELCFGILGEDDLKDVWINHPKLQELRQGLSGTYPGICGDCIHSSSCLMHCVAQNYVENGELLSPDPLCMEAERCGCFPDTRRRSTFRKTAA